MVDHNQEDKTIPVNNILFSHKITQDKTKIFLQVEAQTDVGKVRSSNQDSYLVDTDLGLFIVADGMGGHMGGEIASTLCVTEIQNFFKKHIQTLEKSDDNQICDLIYKAVNHASFKIFQKSLENPWLRGMGTTVNLAYVANKKAYFANVGDSRAYIIRSGYIYQITEDHSLVNEQLKAGIISNEEAKTYYFKNIVTRSVGYQEREEVDTYVVVLENNDLILICSDGLHNKVNEKELSLICSEKKLNAVSHLIHLANQRGGEDNITLILINVKVLN